MTKFSAIDMEVTQRPVARALTEYTTWMQKRASEEGCSAINVKTDQYIGIEHPALAATIYQLAMKKPAKFMLEVGYQSGQTGVVLAVMAAGVMLNGETCFYYGVEDHSAPGSGTETDKLIEEFLLEELKVPKAGWSFQDGKFPDWLDVCGGLDLFDFVFIDHDKDKYLEAVTALHDRGNLARGAWIVFHDIHSNPTYAQFWDDIQKWALDNDLGETFDLRDGFKGITAYDCGLLLYDPK